MKPALAAAVATWASAMLALPLCALAAGTAAAATPAVRSRGVEQPIPPSPTRWVTDNAGFLSDAERAALDQRLRDYEAQSGHQVIVWIGQTTGATPLEDWTIRAFSTWKVGRKGLDDGAILFVFVADRAVRIEVGYGLEGSLTDARSSEIIRNTIVPEIRAGDSDRAIADGVDQIIAAIGGEASPAAEPLGATNPDAVNVDVGAIIAGILILSFIVLAIFSPSTALWLLFTMGSGRGGGWGGGGFGSGGFSGGGGMGGGGGASGRW